MENITTLENLISDIHRAKSLMKILDEHFMSQRNVNLTLDWHSVTRLFNEYGDLSSTVINVLNGAENGLKNVCDIFYKKLREE